MARYKLLAGQHVQADRTKPLKDVEGKPTGRFESRTYKVGDVVESDADLVAKHGPQHFEALDGPGAAAQEEVASLKARIAELEATQAAAASAGGFRTPGDPTPENLERNPSVAPGGQVSSGFQGQPKEPVSFGPAADGLDVLSRDELVSVAEDEEIPVHKNDRKEQIVAAIRAGRK